MNDVSVIVPFFNAERFVPMAATSLAQNHGEGVEFVLVDDCSTDDTLAALERVAEHLPSARLVTLPRNVGLASARNAGLDVATGRYVTFADADDWLAPGYIPRLTAAIKRLGCDFVRVDHVEVRGTRRRIVRSPEARRHEVLSPRSSILPIDRASGIDYPYAWAGMYDTTRLPATTLRFEPGLHTAEDRPWIWRLYLDSESHAVVSEHGVFYRREVADSLTQVGDARQLDFIRAFELVVATVQADRQADEFLPKAIRAYCAVMAHHLRLRKRFSPRLRAELWRRCARSLDRLPPDVLDGVLDGMADRRAAVLRWVRRAGRVTP